MQLCVGSNRNKRSITCLTGLELKLSGSTVEGEREWRVFVVELEGRAYRCKFCKTHLALADDLVSRRAKQRWGRLFIAAGKGFLLHEIGVLSGNNEVFITWKDSLSIMPLYSKIEAIGKQYLNREVIRFSL
ncbi:hypothetical protein RHGRI_018387 [Rhododendron griersonianum]|uniref:Yippee domain-containing protein n=1 Tax=Rhododendron griersonianum TaxID=479676 RepID=A0AAV6K184_9ERIC|nr:hypothetical protein RHGRI_018387 [Rhododendron griersonianum]